MLYEYSKMVRLKDALGAFERNQGNSADEFKRVVSYLQVEVEERVLRLERQFKGALNVMEMVEEKAKKGE